MSGDPASVRELLFRQETGGIVFLTRRPRAKQTARGFPTSQQKIREKCGPPIIRKNSARSARVRRHPAAVTVDMTAGMP